MTKKVHVSHLLLITLALVLSATPGLLSAQALFKFTVNDLEAYNRSGNWIWDADSPTFPTHDGNWFTFGGANPLYHYYAEKNIHYGATTSLTCSEENVPLATDPSQISIVFTEFNMVAFNRINTVNPTMPWNTPGQSGDERVYTNASGYIAYNGTPVLYMDKATFVITTPYPTQAQIRALSPIFTPWTGNIGTGLFQTGYGFGDLNLTLSDPAWAALFAASNYKIDLEMINIISIPTPTTGLFDFTLAVKPSALPRITGNELVDMGSLPGTVTFPGVDAAVEVVGGTSGGSDGGMHHIYLNEVGVAPAGTLPAGLNYTTTKYWELGTTLESFNVNIDFSLTSADFAKASGDWRVIYRPSSVYPWTEWANYTVIDANNIRANNVTQIGEFAIASPNDETLPVELSSFTAIVNSDNLAQLNWTTGSETSMVGYNVYVNTSEDMSSSICLTPTVIPAQNTSTGSSYSFTATALDEPDTYYFWLEALSMGGNSNFYGPIPLTIVDDIDVPELPIRDFLANAYPNPFVSSTRIGVDIKGGEQGTLAIYNLAGQLVSSFTLNEGSHNVTWNGLDSRGRTCANGIYLYKLSTPSFSQTKKLIIVK
ncbi:MAG TPA: T9SS type A sorting domain-containing protein [Candidatus Cloacimonadota bacterium]|nr:T9SS type A sorting domain-containing protein [Candidatus Cloacimonadota bacterium]